MVLICLLQLCEQVLDWGERNIHSSLLLIITIMFRNNYCQSLSTFTFHFLLSLSVPLLIRYLWQLKSFAFMHWFIISTVQLKMKLKSFFVRSANSIDTFQKRTERFSVANIIKTFTDVIYEYSLIS